MSNENIYMKQIKKTKPFLRWAGGKQWLIKLFSQLSNNEYNSYFEPFLGGGSLFFNLNPKKSFLSDINFNLINTYEILKNYPNKLTSELQKWKNDKETYYKIRESKFDNRIKKAAQFIYLNKTCWNGLYRVNKLGKFNVPFGNNNRLIFSKENLLKCSEILKNANLNNCDFEVTLKYGQKADLIYLDPPYTVLHSNNGFRQYNEKLFTWDDQIRLSNLASNLNKMGCLVITSNANNEMIKELYPDFICLQISRYSIIAAQASFRRRITELLFISKNININLNLSEE